MTTTLADQPWEMTPPDPFEGLPVCFKLAADPEPPGKSRMVDLRMPWIAGQHLYATDGVLAVRMGIEHIPALIYARLERLLRTPARRGDVGALFNAAGPFEEQLTDLSAACLGRLPSRPIGWETDLRSLGRWAAPRYAIAVLAECFGGVRLPAVIPAPDAPAGIGGAVRGHVEAIVALRPGRTR